MLLVTAGESGVPDLPQLPNAYRQPPMAPTDDKPTNDVFYDDEKGGARSAGILWTVSDRSRSKADHDH